MFDIMGGESEVWVPGGPVSVGPVPVAGAAAVLAAPAGPAALAAAMSVDPEGLSDTALLDVLERVEASLSVVAGMRARLIGQYATRAPDDPMTWEQQEAMDWHREQLAMRCRTSCHEADVRCRASVDLCSRLPLTLEALSGGELPWAQAVVLARESRDLTPAESGAVERIVLADPRAVTVRQVLCATRAAVQIVRPAVAAEAEVWAHERRSLNVWPHEDGTTDVHARLTTDTAALVAAALEPLAAREGAEDERTAEQRRADALVRLALTSTAPTAAHLAATGLTAASAAVTEGASTGTSAAASDGVEGRPEASRGDRGEGRPEGRVSVRLTLLARTDPWHGLAGGSIDGIPVTTQVLRRLACDATVHVHPLGPDGTVGAEQAVRRLPGAALRRRLEARDQGCAFPTCHTPARRCHAHHIRHWADGGPTTDTNMILLCSRHHHLVHDGGWKLHGPPTRPTWSAPDGRHYPTLCASAQVPTWPKDPPILTAAAPAPF